VSAVTDTYSPSVATLEHWSRFDWRDGLLIYGVNPLETLQVQTKNTTYEISVMDAHRSEILVRGGRFFPVYTSARLLGASLAGSFLKVGGVYVGFCMEFDTEDGRVVTTRVRQITVFKSNTPPS
jgi:hypothetical protein